MTVIKRNGAEVSFDISKITAAVTKANESIEESVRMTPLQIRRIAESVDLACQQALSARCISKLFALVKDTEGAAEWNARYEEKKELLNRLYWDDQDCFYYDIDPEHILWPLRARDWDRETMWTFPATKVYVEEMNSGKRIFHIARGENITLSL